MKGGKAGKGRKNPTGKTSAPSAPDRSAARGAPKRDWGAIPTDHDIPRPAVKTPRVTKDKPSRP